jgi:hypothetical protein
LFGKFGAKSGFPQLESSNILWRAGHSYASDLAWCAHYRDEALDSGAPNKRQQLTHVKERSLSVTCLVMRLDESAQHIDPRDYKLTARLKRAAKK